MPLPDDITYTLKKAADLRYGENPHQPAAVYLSGDSAEASVARATQHHGKPLSYINLLDADAALAAVKDFADPAACVVKHATPCGLAAADDTATAIAHAFAGDPLAAFGGIIAINRPIDRSAADAIAAFDKLLEVIVAPTFAADALEVLRGRWKNVRILEVGENLTPDAREVTLHKIAGGFLVQERDLANVDDLELKTASDREPTAAERADLRFAYLACKHVKSNAVVLARGRALVGVGGGQVDRVAASRQAVEKAGRRAAGSVCASDAFFPFPDGPEILLDAGVTAIVQPGGSVNDQMTTDVVNRRGAAMVFTGRRHFRH